MPQTVAVGAAKTLRLFRPSERASNISTNSALRSETSLFKCKWAAKPIDTREEFGHFEIEIDTAVEKRGGSEAVLLTLYRAEEFLDHLADSKDTDYAACAMQQLIRRIFRSITSDNGSEFVALAADLSGWIEVYFTHPYTSYERGTNENHTRMIRRKILKFESLEAYRLSEIQ